MSRLAGTCTCAIGTGFVMRDGCPKFDPKHIVIEEERHAE